ncbi:MAG: DUF5107 domain-containing protein [Kiritimatiellae bacterium]|nr:DUF5107 domain-containing protein [Kiritimatiellia bacterium]
MIATLLVAGIAVSSAEFPTYPFSDPDPVPRTESMIYPYFRFDGSSETSVKTSWQTVVLDNGLIRVTALPEIGGKIWGAEDLKSAQTFVYFNHTVKFRNIAARGPWCSGGIEFNFGVIGHSPVTATPVDWCVRTNADESVSYFVSATEFICRSFWQVEVKLRAGDRFFTTETTWFNASGLVSPYYQWMNAAFPLGNDPDFLFPGGNYIGHEGDAYAWPVDHSGRRLAKYSGNAFGHNKSYHVLNGDNRFFGIWWPERKIGAYHLSPDGDKYGRKIWLWALSREGGIWEDLLTDADGQYAELQSGRGFNQPRKKNVFTPFKHPAFGPGRTDAFVERWGVLEKPEAPGEVVGDPVVAARPVTSPANFDWNAVYGLYLRGRQALLTREDRAGEKALDECLAKAPHFIPALAEKANLAIRRGEYGKARSLCATALAVDGYDAAANYLDGFAAFAQGDTVAARERLPLAAFSSEYRAAAETLLARAFLREGKWAAAQRAAGRALAANADSPEAALVNVIATRKLGDAGNAAKRAEAILAKLPLYHAARFELDLLRGERWTHLVRNEFPEQTFMEFGSWYEESGLKDEARRLFLLAGDNPIAKIRLGDPASAVKRPVAFAMPFRREERAPLERAVKADPSWKFKFHLAVLLASFKDDAAADAQLKACGDGPDDPVFYLFLATRRNGAARLDALKRAKSCGDSLRVGVALAAHFDAEKDPASVLAVCDDYLARYPKADRLEIAKAKALLDLRRYRECLDFLEGVSILPSEFGDNAGEIWREAALQLGDKAKAELYPERLGLGRPYQEERK